jgi:hypothetical protein
VDSVVHPAGTRSWHVDVLPSYDRVGGIEQDGANKFTIVPEVFLGGRENGSL